jgi:prepilin-type N-terminal cleavage/methylation domain-containing protein
VSARALHHTTIRRRRAGGEDGFTLIETLVAMLLGALLLGGLAALIVTFTSASTRSSAKQVASRELKFADSQMATDVGRAQWLYPFSGGFDAAGADTNGVWESAYRVEGSQLVKYHWTGQVGTAYPGVARIASMGSRMPVAVGIDPAGRGGTDPFGFSYYNGVGGQLDPGGVRVVGTAFLTGSTHDQQISTSISRVTWTLYADPAQVLHLRKTISDEELAGGNSKASPDTPIATTTLTCPSILLSVADTGPVLNWAQVRGVDSYVVSRDGTQLAVLAGTADSYSYPDSSAPTNAMSHYTVQVQVNSGRVVPTCAAVPYLPAPAIHDTSGPGVFSVAWPPITGVTGYTCYYQKLDYATGQPVGQWAATGPMSTATSCTVPAAPGDEGQFKVTATAPASPGGPDVTSGDSNIVQVLASPAAPIMVSQNFPAARAASNTVANPAEFPVGDNTSKTNTVHWYATAATVGYQVWGNTDGAGNKLLATVGQPAGAVAGQTLVSSPTFTGGWGSDTVYTVRAYNLKPDTGGLLLSLVSNSKDVLQYPPAPAIVPAGLTAATRTATADNDGTNTVSWLPAKSADSAHGGGYHLVRGFYSTAPASAPTCLDGSDCSANTAGVTQTSYLDKAVTAGSRYYYEVRAYNQTGVSASFSDLAVLTQHAAAPGVTVLTPPTQDANTVSLSSVQNADAGNPTTSKWCRANITDPTNSGACLYRLVRDGTVLTSAAQQTTPAVNWPTVSGTYGKTYKFQVQVANGSTFNGGWSPVGTVTSTCNNTKATVVDPTVCTYPAPFDMNKVAATAQTQEGLSKQYTYQVSGDAPVTGAGSATIDLSWQASQGDGLQYRYRIWRIGIAPGGWNSAFSASRTVSNYPISDGGYTYDIQVQVRAANGLTRGGGDPTVATTCSTDDPTQTNSTQCTATFQSSPLLPSRLGEVQQYVPGNNVYGNALWAVKYYVSEAAIAGGAYQTTCTGLTACGWDVLLYGTSINQNGSAGASFGSAASWHSGASGYLSGTTAAQLKGYSAEYDFYIQARSTRTGVLNQTTYSPMVKMALQSSNPDVWANSSGTTVHDATYNQRNYPGSWGLGFIRYATSSDSWVGSDAGSADPRDPETHWTAW